MSTEGEAKINRLLRTYPPGVILVSDWLTKQGYSLDLQKRYKRSKWLESIGTGAMIRTGDAVGYEGGIYALQQQMGLTVHPAGRTALSMLGKAHYLELHAQRIILLGAARERLPLWFKKRDWGIQIEYHPTAFLPPDIGMVDFAVKTFMIKISNPARALMECLYLASNDQELIEGYELMQGLNNLRPQTVQLLLEQCQSIKVKRLFMYLATKAGHQWVDFLELGKVHFGSGKRSIVKNGVYIDQFQITVPKALEDGSNV